MEINVLTLFFTPMLLALAVLFLFKFSKEKLFWISFVFSLAPLILLIFGRSEWLQSESNLVWVDALHVHLRLKIDALSYLFIWLLALIVPFAILVSNDRKDISSPNLFYALILFLQSMLIGFFASKDLFAFVLFFEAMLVPLYFLIALWGGSEKRSASLLFLVYMAAGSFLLIAGLAALYFLHQSFDLETLADLKSPYWVGAVFFLAFAVKTPLFPFHAWLPKVYVEADASATILLSAVLSKAGIYGFMRIGSELFPELLSAIAPLLIALAVVGVFYGGFLAWGENNYKRLIAFSSFSHVNFILAGFFAMNEVAFTGAILQAFNHGITIAALFFIAALLEMQVKTRRLDEIRGLGHMMPHLGYLTLFFVLSSIALPLTNMFVGEFLILFGLFVKNPWVSAVLTLSLVLGAIYMLRFMQKVFCEPPFENLRPLSDLETKNLIFALPLAILVLWVGVYPKPFFEKIDGAQFNIKEKLTTDESN